MGGFTRLTNQGGSKEGPMEMSFFFENFDTIPYAYIQVLEATLGDIEVNEGRLQPLKKTKRAETLEWEPEEIRFSRRGVFK